MNSVVEMLGPEGYGSYEVDWTQREFRRVSKSAPTILVPGFIDLHFHGAFGIDFMTASPEALVALVEKLEQHGYEGVLPTTITASALEVVNAVGNLPNDPMILGFHLEGPFLSPKFPGAQPPSAIVPPPPGPSEWDAVLDHPRLRLVTLAPEVPNALALCTRLVGRGVIVSMGHTNATFEEARAGFEHGVGHSTHTFNAMRPFHHREAGAVGYALSNDHMRCELIYDREHVCRASAALLLKTKPEDQVIAVSDSTMATGMPPGTELTMWGLPAEVREGKVCLAGTDTLAGSAITLLQAFRNLFADFGPETAIRACCINPRLALRMNADEPRVYLEFDRELRLLARRVLA